MIQSITTLPLPKNFLCTFRPLCGNRHGQAAIDKYKFGRFVDASCRREPDFESKYPSITALCRKEMFAPRIQVGSTVVYITKKGSYLGRAERHWRLVAILEIIKTFENHSDAANWYKQKGENLPSNCMVEGNLPLALDKTDGYCKDPHKWNEDYSFRAKQCGVFHACKVLHCELNNPPVITEEIQIKIFGKVRGTQNPPSISTEEVEKFLKIARQNC